MSIFSSPVVRNLGLELLSHEHRRHHALKLLEKNYQPGDEALFLSALDITTDEDERHWMGFSLMEIFKNHPTLNAAEIFLHLYENVACTICRDVFIERLIEIDKLPDWLREECKYDANEEVRKLVAAGG